MLVKVQFLRNGEPAGRRYTYRKAEGLDLKIGDKVLAGQDSVAIIVETDVPEEEGAVFGDRLKTIDVKYIKEAEDEAGQEDMPLFAEDYKEEEQTK